MRKSPSSHARMWGAIENSLGKEQWGSIHAKTSGFSRAGLASWESGKALPAPTPVASTPTRMFPPIRATPPPLPAAMSLPLITPAQMDLLVRNASARFAPTQIAIPPEGLECPLPDAPERDVLAYDGWKIVLSFTELAKLGVFNLATGKLDGFIDCADREALLAAGGQLLAVYLPGTQTLEVYDLQTLKPIATKKNPFPGPVGFIGMGLLNPTRIFAVYAANGGPGRSISTPAMVRLPEMTVADLRIEGKTGADGIWNTMASQEPALVGGMDEAGAVAALSRLKVSPSGLAVYAIKENGGVDLNYQHRTVQQPGLIQGGKLITTGEGLFDPITLSDPFAKAGERRSSILNLKPIAGYSGFIAHGADFRIYSYPSLALVRTVSIGPGLAGKTFRSSIRQPIDGLLVSAICDRIACILPQKRQIVLFPLGLKDGSPESGTAQPGQRFEKKLTLPAGATVTIQSGPPGLTYDAGTGALVWSVPPNTKTGQLIQVIMLVKDADGKEDYKVEKISVP